MSQIAREFFTVDLRGLRGALAARAVERCITESDLLRSALAGVLGDADRTPSEAMSADERTPATGVDLKLSIRLPRAAADRLDVNARACGLSRGAYLGRLIVGAPAITPAIQHAEQIAALAASTAEVALLSRDISNLTRLLRQSAFTAADAYRNRFTAVDAEVKRHLDLASALLEALRPGRGGAASPAVFDASNKESRS